VVRAQAPLKLPLSTVWPDGNFHTINCKRFAEEVKKATSGAVDIDVKSGGQLGFKGPEQLRAVRDGLVPMADYLDEPAMHSPMMNASRVCFIHADVIVSL
jgi:TRAP-type C4-dicarboxylate transport system substrate-binding protein